MAFFSRRTYKHGQAGWGTPAPMGKVRKMTRAGLTPEQPFLPANCACKLPLALPLPSIAVARTGLSAPTFSDVF